MMLNGSLISLISLMIFGSLLRICFNGNVFKVQRGKGCSFINAQCIHQDFHPSALLLHLASLQQCDVRLLLGTFSPGFWPNSQHTKDCISDFGRGFLRLASQKTVHALQKHSFELLEPCSQGSPHYLTWQPGHRCGHVQVWRSLELMGDNSSLANESNEAVQSIQMHYDAFRVFKGI